MNPFTLGAHVPYAQAEAYLGQVLELGLTPEIAVKGPELDSLDPQLIEQMASELTRSGIRPTVHAPFFDLNPGALDPLIRQVTYKRLSQTLAFARQLNAHLVVIHPGVDKWRYPRLEAAWCDLAAGFFPALISQAAGFGCRLALENIYEESPETLVKLVNRLDSEWFGHCYDVGHWHLFGKRPMAEWLNAIGTKLFHMHLHDNHGRADEHLPVGEGTIDFTPMQSYLASFSAPLSATLEAHSFEHLLCSHRNITSLFS